MKGLGMKLTPSDLDREIAVRIVRAVQMSSTPSQELEEPARSDRIRINERYLELRGSHGFGEAAEIARAEFVAEFIAEARDDWGHRACQSITEGQALFQEGQEYAIEQVEEILERLSRQAHEKADELLDKNELRASDQFAQAEAWLATALVEVRALRPNEEPTPLRDEASVF